MADIRTQITERIIESIEAGVPAWRKGWTTAGEMHRNENSGKAYRGINQILLALAVQNLPPTDDGKPADQGDPRWLTLKQANAKGLRVKKGAKAAQIVRMVEVENTRATSSADEVVAEDKKSKLVMKLFHVFNGSQIEGLKPHERQAKPIKADAAAEALIEGMKADGVTLLHGGASACYIERLDTVKLPMREDFHSAADFYGTVIHELAHASGSAKRLNRQNRDTRFGSAPYAREELVAELCAAMMLGSLGGGLALGPTHIANHASYIESWVKCLQADKNAIFTAAGAAEKACEYLRERALALSNEAIKQQTIEELKPQPLQLERKTKMRMS
jgi:antirestriction protein ArdC